MFPAITYFQPRWWLFIIRFLAYNIANAIFSGTAPLVQTTLALSKKGRGGKLRPALYLVAIAGVALLALLVLAPMFETRRRRMLAKGVVAISGSSRGSTAGENAVSVANVVAVPVRKGYGLCSCLADDDMEELLPQPAGDTPTKTWGSAAKQLEL